MAGHRPCDGLGTLAFTAHQGKEYAWTSATSMLANEVVPVVTVLPEGCLLPGYL